MATRLNPYLMFPGTSREALEFYRDVFGGELNVMTFGDMGMQGEGADKVMHGQLETPQGFTLMASDPPPGQGPGEGSSISVSLSGDDADAMRGWWGRLAEGGRVDTPLEKQMWGDEFGQVTDRFGVPWLVNIAGQQAG